MKPLIVIDADSGLVEADLQRMRAEGYETFLRKPGARVDIVFPPGWTAGNGHTSSPDVTTTLLVALRQYVQFAAQPNATARYAALELLASLEADAAVDP